MAALEQLVRDHGPDVARAARDEQLHGPWLIAGPSILRGPCAPV
jgi:hypothetical protein